MSRHIRLVLPVGRRSQSVGIPASSSRYSWPGCRPCPATGGQRCHWHGPQQIPGRGQSTCYQWRRAQGTAQRRQRQRQRRGRFVGKQLRTHIGTGVRGGGGRDACSRQRACRRSSCTPNAATPSSRAAACGGNRSAAAARPHAAVPLHQRSRGECSPSCSPATAALSCCHDTG